MDYIYSNTRCLFHIKHQKRTTNEHEWTRIRSKTVFEGYTFAFIRVHKVNCACARESALGHSWFKIFPVWFRLCRVGAFSLFSKALILGLIFHTGMAQAQDNSFTPPPSSGFLDRLGASDTVAGALFGKHNTWDTSFADWQRWKKEHHLPISIGAHNWVHVNNGGPAASGYGVPGLRGTYFWYVIADPELSLANTAVESIGAHVEFRFRDSSDKFRAFFDHTYWFYEAYVYAHTRLGQFKAGQIAKQFGLGWDDTWWGNVQYFDGFKLDTDYGASWENTWPSSDTFKVDTVVQYFVAQADISGSLVGANPQSDPAAHERNIGSIRIVPTWQLSDESSLALGFSILGGDIRDPTAPGRNRGQFAWAADITYKRGGFKIFGEVDQSFGVLHPKRYVSGGPSNRISDVLVGAGYQFGPVLYRIAWSAGFDANPSGHQYLLVPGVTVALTKNVNLFAEYVRWEVTGSSGKRTTFENGFQLVLNWHL